MLRRWTARWQPTELYDAILLDAPCTATGTIRKHPDILSLKNEEQIWQMAKLQRQMLKAAIAFLKPGGTIVFCTCSLQREEGEAIFEFIDKQKLPIEIAPIKVSEVGDNKDLVRPDGTVRTLPHYFINNDPVLSGIDGFFIARFTKSFNSV